MCPNPCEGALLVGSVRLPNEPEDALARPPSTSTVLQAMAEALPQRLKRIPDGETGVRHYFSAWQDRVFLPSPWIIPERELANRNITIPPLEQRAEIVLGDTEYDTVAIASYQEFTRLKDTGIIPPAVRFQVCVPTPINIVARFVKPEFRAEVEPMYTTVLLKALKSIAAAIPAHDLAIQLDCPLEIAMIEHLGGIFTPWFDATPDTLADRICHLASAVPFEAELGFHLCYGDIGHKHFKQPENTSKLVAMANAVVEKVARPVTWFHFPVPADRKDEAFFHPLKQLKCTTRTEIYLGLVHAWDHQGTLERISSASLTLPRFGVATECGWGRTPVADTASLLQILAAVSKPVVPA